MTQITGAQSNSELRASRLTALATAHSGFMGVTHMALVPSAMIPRISLFWGRILVAQNLKA